MDSIIQKITSLQHPLVKHWVKLRKNRLYRYEKKSIFILGKKIVHEVCRQSPPTRVLITKESYQKIPSQETYLVTEAILKKISGVPAPEEIAAEVPMPPQGFLENAHYIVGLDGIRDPGNLGTILRSALALKWQGAFLLNNCCDPYNDKAIRAGKGATFRLPIQMGSWRDLEPLIKKKCLTPVVADLKGQDFSTVKKKRGLILFLGSESHGVSQEIKQHCRPVTIPISPAMESLNVSVAGGILMYFLIKS